MFIEARPGDVRALRADTRLARETLGFIAEVKFEEGLRRYIDWFRATHPDPAALLENDLRNWRLPADTGDELRIPESLEMPLSPRSTSSAMSAQRQFSPRSTPPPITSIPPTPPAGSPAAPG
jgi:hypothetical protein